MIRDELQDGELRDIAQRLGARAAERLDVEATAHAVLERLGEAPRVVRPVWRRPAWLSVAAALLLLLGTRIALRLVHPNAPPVPGSVVAPAGMDVNDLSPGQLREVLRTIDQPVDDGMGPADAGLEDLSTPELRRLLRALEG